MLRLILKPCGLDDVICFVLALAALAPVVGRAAATNETPASPDLLFDFALIGDTPYNDDQATNRFPNMIADINRVPLAFVVHDGDIKSGATPCTDEVLEERRRQFQSFRHPLIYLFGDNEWSDCGKIKTNAFDPEERLDKLRFLFTQRNESLGQTTLSLTRQSDQPEFSKFRENVRWRHGAVVFIGLNVPGDDNHFGTAEFGPRNIANITWIKEAFAFAIQNNLRAIMLIMQANPHFELGTTNRLRQGFNEMLKILEAETVAFGKPVVLVHGDSHYFRIDQPLLGSKSRRRIENFMRVETFGDPDVHWLRVSVDSRDPNVFTFRPQYVRKNLLRHSP
jgi:hypothetical protein